MQFSLNCRWSNRIFRLLALNYKLLKISPDIVISETQIAPLSFNSFALIHVIHDAKFVTEWGRKGRKIARLLHWVSGKLATRILTVSNAERTRIAGALHVPESKVLVSYNGISSAWLAPLPSPQINRYDIIYVSNFARHKGHNRLLRALEGTNYRVLFIGSDLGEQTKIVQLAEKLGIELDIKSGLSEQALISAYDSSRVFVFPSQLEGFGIPYIEARARGLPVVAQDLPVFTEIQQIAGGALVDFDDSAAARYAIRSALKTERCRPNLSMFNWPTIVERLLDDLRR